MDIEAIVSAHRLPEPVFVTRPELPPLAEYTKLLEQIWDRRWLTNDGAFHQEFERRLAEYLGVPHVNLFCNGSIALLVALQALRIDGGEVITTPFTFPATPHVLHWNRVRPVFCDIDPNTYNIDHTRIERLITSDTRAILAVHVYGTPCDVDALQTIADRHGLKVIYDAAHTFGVRLRGRALAASGDISMLSFHATKLFSTIEGGALVVQSEEQKKLVNYLKNFGVADEETVIGPGINGKMNEFQAAYGLLQLEMVESEIAARAERVATYREELAGVPGISMPATIPETRANHAYCPIFIDATLFGMTRDAVHAALKACNIITRKYFHPLCSHYPIYAELPSARPELLPVAERAASQVLCLPDYGSLPLETVRTIGHVLRELHAAAVAPRNRGRA
jgi:dTDP-4-amino-4,6-dideoxygalactose transaminase